MRKYEWKGLDNKYFEILGLGLSFVIALEFQACFYTICIG
jgi:hypothetical protein